MNLFDVLKEKINITDIVSKYLTLRRAGSYLKGKCPFHSEKTASFTISPDKGIFYCFGCHMGGDAVAFIAKVEGCSQIEAAKIIAKDYNIDLPNIHDSSDTNDWFNAREYYVKICQLFEAWCHQMLSKNQHALHYLLSRGLSIDSIKHFKVGFCPSDPAGMKSFLEFCKKNNVLIQDLLEAKLLLQSKHKYYFPFEGRIIFSIKDYLGRLFGFGGRAFEDLNNPAKYYNSHDNQYFKKGHLLFGLDVAKKAIQEKGEVFLVEGYFDVIMMVQSGYKNTVATLGTACTQEHLSQLAQYADKVYVTYDSDKAGQTAIIRMVELCWNANLDLYVIKLPQGHDPASFLNEKRDFKELINKSLDIFDFIVENYSKDFATCSFSEKLRLTKKVLELISKIKDNIKRHILLKRASELFGIPLDMLKNELSVLDGYTILDNKKHESIRQEKKEAAFLGESDIKYTNQITLLEKNLFSAIIYNKGELDLEEEKFLIQFFGSPFKELLTKIHELKISQESDAASLFSNLTEGERSFVSSLVIDVHDNKNTLNELLAQFYKKQWKLIVTQTKLKISQAQKMGDADLVKNLLGRLETLRNKILKRGGAND